MTNQWKISVWNRSAKQPTPRWHSALVIIVLVAVGLPLGSGVAQANDISSIQNVVQPAAAGSRTSRSPTNLHASQAPIIFANVPPPPKLPDIRSYIVLDAKTGAIIAQKSPNLRSQPASLAKLMTAYLAYQAIARHQLQLNQTVPVTTTAWHTPGSRMFIAPSMRVSVNQLLHGLIIDAGNDAAVALAQAVAGTRGAFVNMMNTTALQLGLRNTHYSDVDGLPKPGLYTTARDIGLLSRDIIEQYPQVLTISEQKTYTFDHIRQRNWNPVLFTDPTVDGLATGLTQESGHCIDASAVRKGRRLIAVVLGAPSWHSAARAVEALLSYGYDFYTDATVIPAGVQLGLLKNRDWNPRMIPVGANHALVTTIAKNAGFGVRLRVTLTKKPRSGIRRGAIVGTICAMIGKQRLGSVPAIALEQAEPASLATRLLRHLQRFV